MKTEFLIGFLMILLVCGCAGPGEAETKVVGDVEFRILDAEYESGRIIVTLSTNASVDNARIDIIDEADKLLCTRYKDLIAGTTEIELSDCKAKEEVTVSVSPPGGGIVTQGFALAIPVPVVEVVDAEYLLGGKLELKLKANMDIEKTRMEVSDKSGKVLCTEYVGLSEGLNELRPKGCGTETKLTISVTPPDGVMKTADFTLELPLLELKEGFQYVYSTAHCRDCTRRDSYVYVTKETDKNWEGIAGIKFDDTKKANLMGWKLSKDDLSLSMTRPLNEGALLGGVVYTLDVDQLPEFGEAGDSMIFIWLVLLRNIYGLNIDELIRTGTTTFDANEGQSAVISKAGPELYGNYLTYTLDVEVYRDDELEDSGELIIATVEPYLLMDTKVGNGPQTTFKRLEEKDFSLNDFAGYSIEGSG
ncbi:hypothetical protein KY361_06290 [Candidatus Woesearchaeota archaeon]|nr:hypothetical protein [Candidatus Woesearchaeota archaeon]